MGQTVTPEPVAPATKAPEAPLRAVLFDLDGVLVDSESTIGLTWHAVLTEHGFELPLAQLTPLTTGRSFEHSLSDIQAQHGWQAPEGFVEVLGQRFNAALGAVEAIEGAAQTLSLLREHGIPFAVASNSERGRLALKLRAAGLSELAGTHTYDPAHVGGRGKPWPDLYLYAAQQLNIPIEQCVVIEDSPVGAQAGHSAGAQVWGLLAGGHQHDGSPEQLKQAGATRLLDSHLALQQALAQTFIKPT